MKKYLTAAAVFLLVFILTGCAGAEKTEGRVENQNQTESHLEQTQEISDSSDNTISFFDGTEDKMAESSVQPVQEQSTESSKATETELQQADICSQEEIFLPQQDQTTPPQNEQQPEEPKHPVVTPAPEEPPAAKSTPSSPPQELPVPTPSFDVSAYVQFAMSYGTSAELGLILDNTATSCWDDPLTANAGSLYLERDLKDRLDWYKASGFTRFWVWAEQTGDGEYQVYIGYA